MNRLFRTFLVILVPLLGLLAIGFTVVTGNRWVHDRTQEIVARQLADTVNREVRIGRVSGNLLTGVVVDGIAIASEKRVDDGTLISAKRLQISYDLLAMLQNTAAAAAQISTVRVSGLEVDLKRYPDGQINLEELFPPSDVVVPPDQQFQGKVFIDDAIVHYEDETTDFAQPLAIDVEISTGTVDMRRLELVVADVVAEGGGGEFEELDVSFHLERVTGEYSIDVEIANIDLAWAENHFVRDESVNVLGGHADARGSVYYVKHGEDFATGYSIEGNIAPTEVALRDLSGTLRIDGPVTVTPQGIKTDGLDIGWLGTRLQVSGTAFLADEPTLHVAVAAQGLDVKRLLTLLPAQQKASIPEFALGGPINLDATVTGPLSHANVEAQVEAPETFSVAQEGIDVRGRRLEVAVSLMDTNEPAALGKVTVGVLEAGEVELASGENAQWPKRVGVSRMQDVVIEGEWAGGSPLVNTQIAAGSLNLDGVELTDVRADALLAGTAVHVRDIYAKTFGASLTGRAVVDMSGETPDVYANGVLAGLDIARLKELPPELARLTSVPTGSLDATFAAKYVGGEVSAAATVSSENLAYGEWGPARMGAVVEYDGADVEILSAFVADPLATLWAKGVLTDVASEENGALDVIFRVAEARVDEIAGRFDVNGVAGTLYAFGSADGALSDPHFEAETMLFEPAYEKYDADVIAARLHGNSRDLTVEELILGRGSAAVSMAGTVENLPALASEENGGDGGASTQISGSFAAGGIQVADVLELVGHENGSLDGLAEANGSFGGTAKAPTAKGTVKVAHALTQTVQITEGTVPFQYAQNVLSVEDAAFQIQGSELHADASVDFSGEPYLRASLSAADIYLEGIALLRGLELETAGLLQIPVAKVEGPFDALKGQALLVSEEAMIGNERVTDLRAEVTLDADTVRLDGVRLNVAGGEISGSGFYTLEEEVLTADFALADTSVAQLLDLADPIVVVATRDMPTRKQKDLRRLLTSLSLRLDGVAVASAHIEGTGSDITTAATVDLTETKFDGIELPDVQLAALVDPDGIYDLDLEATQDGGLITVQGMMEFDGDVEMLVEGSGLALASYEKMLPANTNLTGELGFTIVASGESKKPSLMASVDIFEPGISGVGFDLLTAPIVSIGEGKLGIDTLTLKKGEEEVVVDGMLPFSWETGGIVKDKPMQFTAKIEETDLGLIPVLLNEHAHFQARRDEKEPPVLFSNVVASGSLNSTITVSGTPEDPKVIGTLQVADGSLALNEKSKAFRDIGLQVDFEDRGVNNIVSLKKADAVWDDTQVALSGEIDVRSGSIGALDENIYDLMLTISSAKQELVSGLVVQDVDSEITLKGGGSSTPKLTVSNIGGKFGQGSILLNGVAEISDFRLSELANNKVDMRLVADRAVVAVKGLLEGLIDGTVLINGSGSAPADIKGSWVISHGQLGVPPPTGGEPKPMFALSSEFPNPNIDVRIGLGPDMALVAAGLVAPLQPTTSAVHVEQTPQNPVVSGVVLAREGQTQIPGGIATIEKMSVKYKLRAAPGQYGQDPVELALTGDVSGIAESVISSASLNGRELGEVTVRIALVGQLPDQWELRVSSSPPLEEDQIYAILGGVPLGTLIGGGDAGPQDIQQLVSQQFLSALAAGFRMKVFAPIEQSLKRALGLSELSLNFTFNQPVEIKIGKYLMDDLLVSYRTAFGSEDGDEYDLVVAYEVGSQFRVSYSTDERSRETVALEKVWEF